MKISVNTSSKKELFNDLKIKFMLLASVIGTAILLIIFIAIFSAQYGDMHLNIKESLYSTIDDFKNFSGAGSEFDDFDARNHCILLVERNGVIVIKQHFDGYTQTEQSQIINVVTNTDKTKVTIGKRHFQILKASSSNFVFDETVYAIYDYTMEYNSIMVMVIAFSCSIVLSAWLFSLIGWLFAKHAVKPVEYAFQNQKELVTNVSHELKTPLTVLATNINLAKGSLTAKNAEAKSWLDSSAAQIEKMNKLILEMLELSKFTSVFYNPNLEKINLSDFLESTLLSFEATCYYKKITLETKIEKDVWCYVDKNSLERLLSILCDNAIKYTPEDGKIRAGLVKQKKKVVITVSNTGKGISKENLKHIFERFYKVSTDVEQSKSFGLGLSIARSIAESMGGEISCESETDKYTAFIVSLPLERKKTEAYANQKRQLKQNADEQSDDIKSQTDAGRKKSLFKSKSSKKQESKNGSIEADMTQKNDDERQD